MQHPALYQFLTQRAEPRVEPAPLDRAIAYLQHYSPETLWDAQSHWRNGLIFASLMKASGNGTLDPAMAHALAEILVSNQGPDGSWRDPEGLNHDDGGVTGMCVYALAIANRSRYDDAINNGVSWLLDRQTAEGAWVSESSSVDDILADTALVIQALTESRRADTVDPVQRATRYLRSRVTDEFMASDTCRVSNAFVLAWLLQPEWKLPLPKTAQRYLNDLASASTFAGPLDMARSLSICLSAGVEPLNPTIQTALGQLLMSQRPDGSWPGQPDRGPAYVTAYLLHVLPACDVRVSLALSVRDVIDYEEEHQRTLKELEERTAIDMKRQADQHEKEVGLLKDNLREVLHERDLYMQRYKTHVELHEKYIRSDGQVEQLVNERDNLRKQVFEERSLSDKYKTQFWWLLAITASIITGFIVNIVTGRLV